LCISKCVTFIFVTTLFKKISNDFNILVYNSPKKLDTEKSINVPTDVQTPAALLGKCKKKEDFSTIFNSNFNFSANFRSSHLLSRMQWQGCYGRRGAWALGTEVPQRGLVRPVQASMYKFQHRQFQTWNAFQQSTLYELIE